MIDGDLRADLHRTFAAALACEDPAKARQGLLGAGWLDALHEDEPVAAALLFRLQGRTRCDAGALDDVLTSRVARSWPLAADGDLAVAHPLTRTGAGPTTHAVLAARRHARRLLWVERLFPEKLQILEVPDGWPGDTVRGVDPSFGLIPLTGRPGTPVGEWSGAEARSVWKGAVAAGRVAIAHQMTAAALALVELANGYAKERRQFGVPIGSFQAVKHRLADALVAVEAADAAAVAAATSRSDTGAGVAKVLACRAAAVAGRNCLQVFGGIGFTTEHDFHRYYRRNLVLERFLGDGPEIEAELGATLRAAPANGTVIELDDVPAADLIGLPNRV